ncbi:MAG: 50S ribosomal protein L25 [Dehalococcoidia bacterium]|nr:50S ribosomal protein L25 [Dehalococcoidia bacterium]
MEKPVITAQVRKTVGKAVKELRRSGITPVSLYGHKFDSIALQVETPALEKVFAESAHSRFITLNIDKKGPSHTVIIKDVQRDPIKRQILHVDFYRILAEEKIKLEVPIHFIGEPPAIHNRKGIPLEVIRSLEIECLPENAPEALEVDVSGLSETGDSVHVRDIIPVKGVTIAHKPEDVLMKIEEIKVVEEVKEAPAAEVPEGEEQEPVEGEETAE